MYIYTYNDNDTTTNNNYYYYHYCYNLRPTGAGFRRTISKGGAAKPTESWPASTLNCPKIPFVPFPTCPPLPRT